MELPYPITVGCLLEAVQYVCNKGPKVVSIRTKRRAQHIDGPGNTFVRRPRAEAITDDEYWGLVHEPLYKKMYSQPVMLRRTPSGTPPQYIALSDGGLFENLLEVPEVDGPVIMTDDSFLSYRYPRSCARVTWHSLTCAP